MLIIIKFSVKYAYHSLVDQPRGSSQTKPTEKQYLNKKMKQRCQRDKTLRNASTQLLNQDVTFNTKERKKKQR